jgi:competence protein ComEA
MATTPAERKALLFLGAVAVLGVGVRLVAHVRGDRPAVVGMQPELERQLARAEAQARLDKAEREAREKRGAGKRARGARDPGSAKGRAATPAAAKSTAANWPAAPVAPAPPVIVDVDRADTIALATLPGVGPALARRIVADRQARGAFGGLAALDGVSGIGPALLQRLAPRVTFSGPPRPFLGQGKPDVQGRRTGPGPRRRAREGARR